MPVKRKSKGGSGKPKQKHTSVTGSEPGTAPKDKQHDEQISSSNELSGCTQATQIPLSLLQSNSFPSRDSNPGFEGPEEPTQTLVDTPKDFGGNLAYLAKQLSPEASSSAITANALESKTSSAQHRLLFQLIAAFKRQVTELSALPETTVDAPVVPLLSAEIWRILQNEVEREFLETEFPPKEHSLNTRASSPPEDRSVADIIDRHDAASMESRSLTGYRAPVDTHTTTEDSITLVGVPHKLWSEVAAGNPGSFPSTKTKNVPATHANPYKLDTKKPTNPTAAKQNTNQTPSPSMITKPNSHPSESVTMCRGEQCSTLVSLRAVEIIKRMRKQIALLVFPILKNKGIITNTGESIEPWQKTKLVWKALAEEEKNYRMRSSVGFRTYEAWSSKQKVQKLRAYRGCPAFYAVFKVMKELRMQDWFWFSMTDIKKWRNDLAHPGSKQMSQGDVLDKFAEYLKNEKPVDLRPDIVCDMVEIARTRVAERVLGA